MAIYCIKLPEFKLKVFIYDLNLCISVSVCVLAVSKFMLSLPR